ncbi:MAG: glycosyltransferase [Candidatus Aminicenantes bacterium]|nr:MAG: glycosyltransferase [Candidatus Aminicenantes bacterium]
MRILVISNLYPPYHKSDYEIDCQDIVESLKNRQHQIQVLTSSYGLEKTQIDNNTRRMLTINFEDPSDWKDVFLKELVNQTVFKRTCLEFKPDLCFFFNLSHVSLSLSSLAMKMDLSVCFYYANNWFVTREKDQWHQLWPKGEDGYRILRYLTNRFKLLSPLQTLSSSHSIFTNSYLKNLALECHAATPEAIVIPCGVNVNRFPYNNIKRQKPHRLLYVGQIHPDKGIDDAIKALFLFNRRYGDSPLSLTIVGDEKSDPDYSAQLKDFAGRIGISEELKFFDFFPQEKMPELFRSHDIFLSPSHTEESPIRSLLEAMSSGMVIVSTPTVSKSEILEDGVNALLFPKGNPDSCVEKIHRLVEDTMFLESIRMNARSTIERKFQLSHSVDSIEQFLNKIAETAKPFRSPYEIQRKTNLDNLVRRAKRWLALGKCVVFARILLRPKFFFQIPVKIYKKLLGFTPHSLHKIIFDVYFFLKGRRRKKSTLQSQHMQRILVLHLADMGDVVLTSPFLRELQRCFPKAWIGLVVQPRMYNLVEKCPYVDEVFSYDWGPSQQREKYLRGSPHWWTLASRTAKHNFWDHQLDLAISTRWNEDPCQAASLIFMYVSGTAHRVAYKGISSKQMRYGWKDLDRLITEGPIRGHPQHEVEQQLDILRFLGAMPDDNRLEVWTSQEDEQFAQNVLNKYGITQADGIIAFAPGAAWPFRRWPAQRFIELGQWLQDTFNVFVLILAAKNEEDLALKIEKGLRDGKTVNLAGKTTLREMAAVLKHCNLFVGNDSGPLHVATAAGIPVVGFYGPGEYHRFKPWGMNQEALWLDLSCSPCSQNCLFSEPRCIEGITLNQVKNLLAQKMPFILDLS